MLSSAVPRLNVVVVLDDVTAVAHTHELGIVRAFNLRCGDLDQTGQHCVCGTLGIPI